MKKQFQDMNARSFLPVAIAGGFAIVLLIVLGFFVLKPKEVVGPSQEELAVDYANGLKYERGDNVTVNYQTAMDFYRKAADAGYPPAELSVGILYMTGRGTAKDPKQADDWFHRAAEHGLPEGQVQYAGDLISGIGTADGKPDKIEALKWLQLGTEGVTDPLMKQVAQTQREKLAGEMTADERAEAQARTDAWLKEHAPPE
jgi:hypothetical protein